jgi:hypothetical protein
LSGSRGFREVARTWIAFTRNTVSVAVELVRVTRISPQHRLCVGRRPV